MLPIERTFFASLARQLDAWVRHVIIYNTPDKSGLSKKQHFEKVRTQLEKAGKSKEELDKQFIELVEPELTRIGDDFVHLFFDLSSTRQHTQGGAMAISYSELMAYTTLNDMELEPWEVNILRVMDRAYLEELRKTGEVNNGIS